MGGCFKRSECDSLDDDGRRTEKITPRRSPACDLSKTEAGQSHAASPSGRAARASHERTGIDHRRSHHRYPIRTGWDGCSPRTGGSADAPTADPAVVH